MLEDVDVLIEDYPVVTLAVAVVVTSLVYAGIGYDVDGRLDLLETGVFAVAFAVALVGLSFLRRRFVE